MELGDSVGTRFDFVSCAAVLFEPCVIVVKLEVVRVVIDGGVASVASSLGA